VNYRDRDRKRREAIGKQRPLRRCFSREAGENWSDARGVVSLTVSVSFSLPSSWLP
jgi:hypothetical protein